MQRIIPAKKESYPKVLFYTSILRSFRSTLIGYLYEISQTYPVVLLSEELDQHTQKIIKNKKLFPKLEKIVQVRQYGREKTNPLNLIARHRYFSKLAENLILENKPDIVFATGADIFASYLRRFAKKVNAITVAGTGPFFISRPEAIKTFRDLLSAYTRFPAFLPKSIKILCSKLRRYSAHFFYYYISPTLAGQKPFFKEPSMILQDVGNIRGADYYFVFLKTDYDVLVKNNRASAKKVFILAHPLQGRGKEVLEKLYFSQARNKYKNNGKILTVMWPEIQIGFRKSNFALIFKEEIRENRIKTVSLITQILKRWKIFIKPHPMVKDIPGQLQEIARDLEPISNQIKVTDPSDSAEEYIERSDVIVGIPPASYSIFTASLQCPRKPILSLDLNQEFLGDAYKNLDGVEYIDNEKKLIHILELIRNGKYRKKIKTKSKTEGFTSAAKALEWIIKDNLIRKL